MRTFKEKFNIDVIQVGKLGKLTFTYLNTQEILGYFIEFDGCARESTGPAKHGTGPAENR